MTEHSFDSAAANYDAVRGFPPGIGEQVAQAAVDRVGQGARILEVGIGTGRIAKPLLALGLNVTGLDLSAQMIGQLRATLPVGCPAPALVFGDAAHLPFNWHVFDAVVTVHVFQLLADWTNPLSEVRRVLRPGGMFLNGYEWRPSGSPGARLLDHWRLLLESMGLPAQAAGARDFSDLKAALEETGVTYKEQDVGQWSTARTLAQQLETIEHRTWLAGRGDPNSVLAGCLQQLRSWATAEFGALDQEHRVAHHFVWQCFTWG